MRTAVVREPADGSARAGSGDPRGCSSDSSCAACGRSPTRRFQHMGDVKVELEDIAEGLDSSATMSASGPTRTGRSRRRWLAAAAAGLVVLAVATVRWHLRRPPSPPPAVTQLSTERWAGAGTFSPDGTLVAYASAGDDGVNWDIWLKLVGEPQARRLTTDPAVEAHPAWSPDGTEIAFLRLRPGSPRGVMSSQLSAGEAYVVSPLGGPPRRVSGFPAQGRPSWSPDGRWLAVSKARSGSDAAGGDLPRLGRERGATTPDLPETPGLRPSSGIRSRRPRDRATPPARAPRRRRAATCTSCRSTPRSLPWAQLAR